MQVTGWRCAICGTTVGIAAALPWRCPRATPSDPHHVLHPVSSGAAEPLAPLREGDHPLLRYDERLAWAAFAAAHGLGPADRAELVSDVDGRVALVDGHGFHVTPMWRAAALSDELGFSAEGGVWVKDETGQVAGSQKARHLVTILLHLLAAERLGLAPWRRPEERPPLAISSCGNAAIAASTLAAAAGWPIEVFVPPWASPAVMSLLARLGANVRVCPRRDDDPPGDPCLHRLREAIAAGAVPFTVQGPENALCLDGGRTLGWELLDAAGPAGMAIDHVFVQVGGGAFAACVGMALAGAAEPPRLVAVQAEGCAPLAAAWRRARELPGGPATAAQHWPEVMRVWGADGQGPPHSLADGILDDETYDGIAVLDAVAATGGDVVVAPEAAIVEAHELARRCTDVPVSATGSAGLAGLLAARGRVGDDERVVVVFSGVAR